MRLARHDKIVERMAEQVARAIYAEDVRVAEADTPAVHRPERWANPFTDVGMALQKAKLLTEGRVYATAALDAMLEAVVRLGVGGPAPPKTIGYGPDTVTWQTFNIRMEARDDESRRSRPC